MKKFYFIEQIADCLVVSTRRAQIGDKGPGRTGALVSHHQLSAPRCARMQESRSPSELRLPTRSVRTFVCGSSGKKGEHLYPQRLRHLRWPCGEFEMSYIKQRMS